jgi:hypothetical protein
MKGEGVGMGIGDHIMRVIAIIRLVTHTVRTIAGRIIISHTPESFPGGSSY